MRNIRSPAPTASLADPRLVRIPVVECEEPLVDLRSLGVLWVDARLADDAGAYAHVRKGVADRLIAAQTLLPRTIRLLVIEAYRPVPVQRRYFAARLRQLRTVHPDWSEDELWRTASGCVAPPETASHVSGGAVDLTLATERGELPMGTDVNATPEQSNGACHTDASGLSTDAVENRRVLASALSLVQLVNYPTEWWHWSYGDRYWAMTSGTATARYGPLVDPELSADARLK